jgi:S1-C subfamily serine protease
MVLPDFTDLYEKNSPAVVSIDVTQKVKQVRFPELSEDDPFYEFFRRFRTDSATARRPEREQEQSSVGSASSSPATAISSPMPTSSKAPRKSRSISPTNASSRPRSSDSTNAPMSRS